MAVNSSAMVVRRRFGEALKQERLKARTSEGRSFKQIDVARALKRKTVDRVSRFERGEAWPEDNEWNAIATLLNLDSATRVRLETMLREGKSIGSAWWTAFADEFPESLIQFVAYEDAAEKITTCCCNILPGLLQTPDYAQALTSSVASSVLAPDMVKRSVELRANRRAIFDKTTPTSVETLIAEGALWQRVGGPEVMLRQLDSLIEDCTDRDVTVRVVPFTAAATSTFMMHLLEFDGTDTKPVAAFDSMTGMVFRKNPRDIRESRHYIDSIRDLSLSPLASLEKLKTIRKEISRV